MRKLCSRWVNHRLLGGDPHFMISSRMYYEHRYGWILAIDLLFYLIRREHHHCLNCYCLDVKERNRASFDQDSDGKA